jgi:anti-sigma B factor antagonist
VQLKISTEHQNDYAVVAPAGEIDLHTAPRLQTELNRLVRMGCLRVAVDLSGVEFCDSTGVNVLLAAFRRVRDKGGDFSLIRPQNAVRKVLRITGLDSVFPVHETVESAFGTGA